MRKGTKIVLVPLPPAVGRAIDRAVASRGRGPIRPSPPSRHVIARAATGPAPYSRAASTFAPARRRAAPVSWCRSSCIRSSGASSTSRAVPARAAPGGPGRAGSGGDDRDAEAAAGQAGELVQAAVTAHRAMPEPASRLTGAHCRRPSLLPGRSRGHVLAHWARHADGQSRMLAAAPRGVVTAQHPGGDAQRAAETGAGAARPARVIFDDARAAISRPQDPRQQMPASAGERPAAARARTRPARLPARARRRETEIHHAAPDTGYTHDQRPAQVTACCFPRVPPGRPGWPIRSPSGPGQQTATWPSRPRPRPPQVTSSSPAVRRQPPCAGCPAAPPPPIWPAPAPGSPGPRPARTHGRNWRRHPHHHPGHPGLASTAAAPQRCHNTIDIHANTRR
jgi:hypothetical protein